MRGQFVLWPDTPKQLIIPNNLLDEGEESFLKMIFQDDQTDVPGGNDFFVGLCGAVFAEDTTLATLTGEPTVTNGYARQAIPRSTLGWPTISEVNGVKRIQSAIATFTPAGGDFSTTFQRMFLTNVGSGTAGLLFSVSGALPAPVLITLAGGAVSTRYEFYLR